MAGSAALRRGQHAHRGRRRFAQGGGHRVQPGDRVVVGGVPVRRRDVDREDVRDQQDRAVVVVQHGQVGGEHHRELRHAQVVGRGAGQPLEAAHRVVADVADQPAGERREVRQTGRLEPLDRLPQRLQRVLGVVRGAVAGPHRATVALGEHGLGPHPDEGVARPRAAVLGGLEQERARAVARERAVEADRGEPVGEQPAGHRDHRLGGGQGVELRPVRPDDAVGHAGGPPTTAPRSTASKHVRSPV